ncbi:MAG: prolipoprotein diacylglyceryl transferase [Christensenellales bacterium]|jgi:phosphatidylglycerol:prolipoprotein diacylglycerol transferase
MNRVAFSLFGKDIYWYGIIIACALIIGVVLGVREAKRRGFRPDMILDFMLIAIPVCIVCARIYYVIFEWSSYSSDFLKIFAIWQGGLAIYGAIIGGVIAAIIFYKWRKVPIGEILDIAAPSIIIGQAIGRWGNFINQEAHGEQILNPDWQWFPAGVQIEGIWYQATFFYESVWNFIVFIILMLLRKRIKIQGGIFALYVVLYGFGRFWIESLRTDSLMWKNLRVSQGLSALLFIGGIIYLFIMSRNKKEYPVYDGLYSINWTETQIREYKEDRSKKKACRIKKSKSSEKE